MKRGLEQDFVNEWLKYVKSACAKAKIPEHHMQIETGGTEVGVPDLFVMYGTRGIWLEAKRARPDRLSADFQPRQIRTLRTMAYTHLLYAGVLLLFDDMTFALELAPQAPNWESTIQRFPEASKHRYDLPEIVPAMQEFIDRVERTWSDGSTLSLD